MKIKKNPYHNFTKKELKDLIIEHNLRAKQREMMPKLDLNDPKIRRSIERGKKIFLKMALKERKILEKARGIYL